jgi:tRNA(Ile2) C34 agmatinyltransferase TiaS
MELSLRFHERLLALVSTECNLIEGVAGSSQLHCPRCACHLDSSPDGGFRCPRCSLALAREDRHTLIELHAHASGR